MGGYKLEIFRMALYVSFPIGIFYYFNNPDVYRQFLEKAYKKRAEMLANRTEMHEVRDIVAAHEEKRAAARHDHWIRAREELIEKRKQSANLD